MWQERKPENSGARTVPVPPSPKPTASAATLIGKGMLIKGRIESQQDLYIDGEVQGSLDVPNSRLTVGPNGKVRAGAKARELDVQGAIEGNVESSEKVSVRTGGSLVGDVRTAGIVIEDGAFFKGTIDIVKRASIPIVEAPQRELDPVLVPSG